MCHYWDMSVKFSVYYHPHCTWAVDVLTPHTHVTGVLTGKQRRGVRATCTILQFGLWSLALEAWEEDWPRPRSKLVVVCVERVNKYPCVVEHIYHVLIPWWSSFYQQLYTHKQYLIYVCVCVCARACVYISPVTFQSHTKGDDCNINHYYSVVEEFHTPYPPHTPIYRDKLLSVHGCSLRRTLW